MKMKYRQNSGAVTKKKEKLSNSNQTDVLKKIKRMQQFTNIDRKMAESILAQKK